MGGQNAPKKGTVEKTKWRQDTKCGENSGWEHDRGVWGEAGAHPPFLHICIFTFSVCAEEEEINFARRLPRP